MGFGVLLGVAFGFWVKSQKSAPPLHYGLARSSEHEVLTGLALRVAAAGGGGGGGRLAPGRPPPTWGSRWERVPACQGAEFQAGIFSNTAFLETHKQLKK